MKQILKKTFIIVAAICTIATVLPAVELNVITTEANASTSDDGAITKLKLKNSSGKNIQIYDDNDYKSGSKVDDDEIDADTKYYAKTSSSKIKIDVDGVDDDCVRLFVSEKSSEKGVKVGKTATLSSGTNKITVRVYNEDPGSSIKYKEDDDVVNDYTIRIKYTGNDDDDDDDDEDYDDIYLKSITLSDGEISFSKKTTKYDVYVASTVSNLTIKAKPEDEDYTVTIDGTEVDDDDNYKEEVSLSKGKNTIEIEVEDEDEDESRVYTLNIYRGETSNGTSSNVNNNINTNNSNQYNPVTSSPVISTQPNYQPTNSKVNQWVMNNGNWQYYDSLGKPLTSQWFFDNNSGKYYYLGADGNMATGWIYMSGQWYLFDNSGAMLTGWHYSNGKWYYLNPANGAMVTNSYVGSYKVDSTGAWVK